jgi:hypothetical protein
VALYSDDQNGVIAAVRGEHPPCAVERALADWVIATVDRREALAAGATALSLERLDCGGVRPLLSLRHLLFHDPAHIGNAENGEGH